MADRNRSIVERDLTIALSNVTVGLLLTTVTLAAGQWWVGVVAGAAAIAVSAAADRSSAGNRVLVGAGICLGAVVIVAATTDAIAFGVVPLLLIGMGAGLVVNRVLFGVVRPVPAARKRREQSG